MQVRLQKLYLICLFIISNSDFRELSTFAANLSTQIHIGLFVLDGFQRACNHVHPEKRATLSTKLVCQSLILWQHGLSRQNGFQIVKQVLVAFFPVGSEHCMQP